MDIHPPAAAGSRGILGAPSGFEEALRRAHQQARAALAGLELPYERFAAHVSASLRARLGEDVARARLIEELGRLSAVDLFLALACVERVPGAWRRLMESCRAALERIALREGASAADAEEVVADALGDLASAADRGSAEPAGLAAFEGRSSLLTWLGVIVLRRLADRRRERFDVHAGLSPGAEEESRCAGAADPAELAQRAETRERIADGVRRAWSRLTEREALTLLLKYRDRLSQVQIARLLGTGEPRVSRLHRRAIEKLRAAVANTLGDPAAQEPLDDPDAWELLHGFPASARQDRPRAHDPVPRSSIDGIPRG